MKNVVAAMLSEDSHHAQREQENPIPVGDSETAKGQTGARRAEKQARRYAAVPAARIQAPAAGRRGSLRRLAGRSEDDDSAD